MSQAGITRGDRVAYLEAHGWERHPRRHGEKLYWKDPIAAVGRQDTEMAYEICKRRVDRRGSRRG